jgi:hypothetical protein
MIIHFSGRKNIDNPGVRVFPKLLVCLDCGFSRVIVPETELAILKGGFGIWKRGSGELPRPHFTPSLS